MKNSSSENRFGMDGLVTESKERAMDRFLTANNLTLIDYLDCHLIANRATLLLRGILSEEIILHRVRNKTNKQKNKYNVRRISCSIPGVVIVLKSNPGGINVDVDIVGFNFHNITQTQNIMCFLCAIPFPVICI